MTRFYIPGETSISERIRKQAYDTGCYTLMHYLNKELSSDDPHQKDIKSNIREKVLNWLDLADLQYHAKCIKLLIDKPEVNSASAEQDQPDDSSPMLKPTNVWLEQPNLRFPLVLLECVDKQSMHAFLLERSEILKQKIEKRKLEDNKRAEEKRQQHKLAQEQLLEQKRKRHDEIQQKVEF